MCTSRWLSVASLVHILARLGLVRGKWDLSDTCQVVNIDTCLTATVGSVVTRARVITLILVDSPSLEGSTVVDVVIAETLVTDLKTSELVALVSTETLTEGDCHVGRGGLKCAQSTSASAINRTALVDKAVIAKWLSDSRCVDGDGHRVLSRQDGWTNHVSGAVHVRELGAGWSFSDLDAAGKLGHETGDCFVDGRGTHRANLVEVVDLRLHKRRALVQISRRARV